jgi:hypothetical protein
MFSRGSSRSIHWAHEKRNEIWGKIRDSQGDVGYSKNMRR